MFWFWAGVLVILVGILDKLLDQGPKRGRAPVLLFAWLPSRVINFRAAASVAWLLWAKLCEEIPFLYGHRLFAKVAYWQYHFGTFGADFGPARRVIVLDDPESLRHMMQTNFSNYKRADLNVNTFKPVLGDGIFNANGESWKFQRSAASPFFKSRAILETMAPVFEKHTELLCHALEGFAESGQPVDMQDLFNRFTLDSICEVAFGESVGSLESNVPFNAAFNRVIHELAFREENPFWKLFVWRTRQFNQDLAELESFVSRIIRKLKDLSPEELAASKGLLAGFMQIEGLSDDFLRDITVNFLLAGRDTTSQLLTWTTYFVSQSPAVEAKLVEEVGQSGEESGRSKNGLPYHKQVFNETLRVVPPVPLDGRQAIEDDVLPNGVFVPAGWLVAYAGPVYGRLKGLWGEDADIYDPDRFGHPRSEQIRPYQFLSFYGGEQRCLGQQTAYVEAQICFSALMKRFSFEVAVEPKARRGLTIFADGGLWFRVRPRASVSVESLKEKAAAQPPYSLRLRDRFAWRNQN